MKRIEFRTKKVKCNWCDGKGWRDLTKIQTNWIKYPPTVRKQALKLVAKGMTLRKIAKTLGMNHPYSVTSLINRKRYK